MSKEVEIRFSIVLDDNNIPVAIFWEASDSEFEGKKPCDSVMISIWDKKEKNALSIDLWTKDMIVGEMNAHFFLTLMKMAETYERATKNNEVANMIKGFANDFATKVEELTK
ncbi:MAG TPA: gliding motility protein GldC [Thermodesulfobacteriota bacterium]|nr:gliding motility protein GldC [Thermodesulfobacteriota bacterium]